MNYYLAWAKSGDPEAPRYCNFYGTGPIEHIRDKIFAALDSHISHRRKGAGGKRVAQRKEKPA